MAEVEELSIQNLEYKNIEELFEDRDSDIFDTILLNEPMETVKNKLKLCKDQGTDMHNIYKSLFHHFSMYQTLSFHEFVDWCTVIYSSSKRVIMDISNSTIPCPVIPLIIRKDSSVLVEFSQKDK